MNAGAAPAVAIRRHVPADRPACLQVFRSNVPRYFAAAEQSEFEDFLALPGAELWVVELDGAVVACGGIHVGGRVGRLCWGMVSQHLHRGSIGTALLRWRVDALFADPAVAEVGIDTSQHSAGFFARFGFVVTATEPDGLAPGLDRVAMSLARSRWQAGAAPAAAAD